MGVTPPESMLTKSVCFTRFGISSSSFSDCGASIKAMSAPASQQRFTRSMASSRPFIWRASVRAKMRKSGSLRAATADLILSTISPVGTTCLLAKWPQRLGITWSSSKMPAAPADSKASTVRWTLWRSPWPVSPSAMTGIETRAAMRRTASAISVMVRKFRSARPSSDALVPKPPMKTVSKPACSTMSAVKTSWAPRLRMMPGFWRSLRMSCGPEVVVMCLKAVQQIDHLAQAAVVAFVELEGQPRQVHTLIVLALFCGRPDQPDLLSGDDVGEVFVEVVNGRLAGRVLEPDDQQLAHEAHGVIIAIEPRDNLHRLIGVVRDLVKAQIVGRDEVIAQQ